MNRFEKKALRRLIQGEVKLRAYQDNGGRQHVQSVTPLNTVHLEPISPRVLANLQAQGWLSDRLEVTPNGRAAYEEEVGG